jgi:predicted nucleotidyltransferase
MYSETFGERIRRLRVEQGISLRELAAALNYDQSSLSKVERNALPAPAHLIRGMAEKLGDDYRELVIKYQSERVYYLLKACDYALESLEVAKRRLEQEGSGTTRTMQRAKLLRRIKDYLAEQPVDKAWIFGSFARNQASYDSDLDILVQFMRPNKLNLLDFVGMKQDLEKLSGRQVDLVEETSLMPSVRDRIEQEKMLIYER